jgi:hypothetical protein
MFLALEIVVAAVALTSVRWSECASYSSVPALLVAAQVGMQMEMDRSLHLSTTRRG